MMSRRTFLSSTAAFYGFIRGFGRAFAQPETFDGFVWDDTSALFGNAWKHLGTVEQGSIDFLSLQISTDSPESGITTLLGVIHNNTDEPWVLTEVMSPDPTLFPMGTTMQQIISPNAYALGEISILKELYATDDLPEFEPIFRSVNDLIANGFAPIQTQPLAITEAAFTGFSVIASLRNDSDTDIPEFSTTGKIIWFDDDGRPVLAHLIDVAASLGAGESRDIESLIFVEPDPHHTFLIGIFGHG